MKKGHFLEIFNQVSQGIKLLTPSDPGNKQTEATKRYPLLLQVYVGVICFIRFPLTNLLFQAFIYHNTQRAGITSAPWKGKIHVLRLKLCISSGYEKLKHGQSRQGRLAILEAG